MTHSRNADASRTAKDEQRTPISLFNRLNERFHFDLDVACTKENCLSRNGYGYTKSDDALGNAWCNFMMDNGEYATSFFCNPPYSKGNIDRFVYHAYLESLSGGTSVCLLPADTSTQWFQICMAADEWIIIEGRVRFNHADGTPIKGSPKFGSIVVVFKDTPRRKNLGFPVVSSMRWR